MSLTEIAAKVLNKNMGLRAGEEILVVTDEAEYSIGQAFYEAAQTMQASPVMIRIPVMEVSGSEPPKTVAAAMAAADVVICPTLRSLTHTNARIQAAKAGARIATMPGITETMFAQGAITADYEQVEALTLRLTERLTQASRARVEKNGHCMNLSLAGRKGIASTGVYREKGQSGNLPSGEAYIAPLENDSNGTMEIDGSMAGIGKLSEPLIIQVQDGRIRQILGKDAYQLKILLKNEANATLCELGIGTNDKADLCGIVLEDEKVYATVHLAFGTNLSFGGTVKADCHLDGVILNPTLYLDDRMVLENGRFCPDLGLPGISNYKEEEREP